MKPAKLALPLTAIDLSHKSRGHRAEIREASGAKVAAVETMKVALGIVAAVNDAAKLRSALEKIANPLDHLRKDAEAKGMKLDGMMAVSLAESHNYLTWIARDALKS